MRKRERQERARERAPAASRSAARLPSAADSLAAVRYTRGYLDLANALSTLPASGPFGLKSISRRNRGGREDKDRERKRETDRERERAFVSPAAAVLRYNETASLIRPRSTSEF